MAWPTAVTSHLLGGWGKGPTPPDPLDPLAFQGRLGSQVYGPNLSLSLSLTHTPVKLLSPLLSTFTRTPRSSRGEGGAGGGGDARATGTKREHGADGPPA